MDEEHFADELWCEFHDLAKTDFKRLKRYKLVMGFMERHLSYALVVSIFRLGLTKITVYVKSQSSGISPASTSWPSIRFSSPISLESNEAFFELNHIQSHKRHSNV